MYKVYTACSEKSYIIPNISALINPYFCNWVFSRQSYTTKIVYVHIFLTNISEFCTQPNFGNIGWKLKYDTELLGYAVCIYIKKCKVFHFLLSKIYS